MGDLQSEINSLKWINLFLNAIVGNSNLFENSHCFKSFGYNFIYSPPFTLYIDNIKSKTLHPDFLLWNNSDEIALIIEVKGERSISEDHIKQLDNYNLISPSQVKDLIFNETGKKVSIKKVLVGIVYIEEIINNCESSEINNHLIHKLKENYLLFSQKHEGELKCYNRNLIPPGTDLEELFREKIFLQKNPKSEIYLTETPCIKGIIYAIYIYIQRKFFDDNIIDSITISPNDLHREFKYSRASLSKIKKSLDYISRSNYCEKNEDNEYKITYEKCLDIIKNWKKIEKELIEIRFTRFLTVSQENLDKLTKPRKIED